MGKILLLQTNNHSEIIIHLNFNYDIRNTKKNQEKGNKIQHLKY